MPRQVAKAVGATVVAVDLGPEKAEFLRRMGADYVVDAAASSEPLHKRIKKLVPKGTPRALCSLFRLNVCRCHPKNVVTKY